MTTNSLNPLNVERSPQQGHLVDKGYQPQINITILTTIEGIRNNFIRTHGMRSPQFTVLMMMVDKWNRGKEGMTIFEVAKNISPNSETRSEIFNSGEKVKKLLAQGFIECIGKGRYDSNVYIPTQGTIEIMQGIVEGLTK